MDVGNLVAIAFGLVGSAAGVGTAIWVYRRERKERSQEREAARKEALEAGERRQREEQEQRQVEEARHARDVRRAKHQDDYRATQAALEKLKEIAYSVRVYGLWTASKIDEIDEVRERLDRL